MTEQLHCHISLSCIGEGNGNPLQCSCLENPRDRGAWWAAVYGVAQSRTRLKRLSSSSSSWLHFPLALHQPIPFSLLTQSCLFAIPWAVACQVSLSFTVSQSLLKLMSMESVMPSNYLMLCHSLRLLPSILPSIRVFSNE